MVDKEAFEKLVRDELVRPTLLLLEKAGIVKVRGDKVVLTEKGKRYAETQLELMRIEHPELTEKLIAEIEELSKLSEEELDERLRRKLEGGRYEPQS